MSAERERYFLRNSIAPGTPMSPKQDFVSAKASTKPWSHLRGAEEISPEVPLSFGIRKVVDGSCGSRLAPCNHQVYTGFLIDLLHVFGESAVRDDEVYIVDGGIAGDGTGVEFGVVYEGDGFCGGADAHPF